MHSTASTPLRVLMVTPRFFPDVGGVETHVYEVARRLARASVDITILTTDRSGQLPTSEPLEGVTVRRVRAWPEQRDYYFAPEITRVITQGSWDVVHCQSYHTLVAPMAMLAALRAHIPYVVTFHGGGCTRCWRGPTDWLLLPGLKSGCTGVRCASCPNGLFLFPTARKSARDRPRRRNPAMAP